ncbi:hypothetical protein [Aeromonas phage 59.1]|nr:hypothetical protein [Aeromonas phage 59.1]
MTETEKAIAYHEHEANRNRLIGYAAMVKHHEAMIEKLKAGQAPQPSSDVLTKEQALQVANWMRLEFHNLIKLIDASVMGSLEPELSTAHAYWLYHSLRFTQSDLSRDNWAMILELVTRDKAGFGLSLKNFNDMDAIIEEIKKVVNNA